MEDYFYELADALTDLLQGPEVLLAGFQGEESDFARLNHGLARQVGAVTQWQLSIELIDGRRHVHASTTLTGHAEDDRPRAAELLAGLREALPTVPEDPYLLYATEPRSGRQVGENHLGDARDALDAVLAAGRGRDMVGLYAQGAIQRGFANSLGQRNWFSSHSFHLDWTFYHQADKAVKATYAGRQWDADEFARKVAGAAGQLEVLARPAMSVEPGEYRVYLAPAALRVFLGVVAGGGFGLERCEVTGSKGRFVLEEACEDLTFYTRTGSETETYHHLGGMTGFGETFQSRIHRWLEQNAAKVPPSRIDGSGEDALKVQTIIEAAITSWEEKRVVDLR